MLSIQEVNYFTKLVKNNLANPIECPFDIKRTNHIVYSKVDKNFNVLFRCAECNSDFKLGYNSEKYIKDSIKKII